MAAHDDLVHEPTASPAQPARSRRAILAGALGGVAGAVAAALGRPLAVSAAPGDAMIIGADNFGSGLSTKLNATSSGGALWVTQNGFGSGVRGDSVSGHGGVFATQHGARYGVNASNTTPTGGGGAAVNAAGGNANGLVASTSFASAYAVKGTQSAASSYTTAIYGEISSTGALQSSYAVQGVNKGTGVTAGAGVYGQQNGSGYGVQGYSTNGYGMFGSSNAGASGVHGQMTSGGGSGVSGVGNGQFGAGVSGSSIGTSGHGLSGSVSTASNTASGVYGYGPAPAYAGYFEGNVSVTGAFSAPASIVALDHPLDPSRKILRHAAVESSELKTIYDGTVTTDGRGRARVELPAWFEALNGDVRYQLTVVGGPAQAWIDARLADGAFVVATSEPGTDVCWQVTGVRRDAYAKAHPLAVEARKSARDTGSYLHPQEHGQPATKGIGYDAIRRLEERAARLAEADGA